jgi:hypothetical protein
MKLRKFIHEHIFDIVNDSTGDINAAQQFLNDIEGSEKFNYGDVDIDFNNHTISIEIESIHEEFPFYAILDFELISVASCSYVIFAVSKFSVTLSTFIVINKGILTIAFRCNKTI